MPPMNEVKAQLLARQLEAMFNPSARKAPPSKMSDERAQAISAALDAENHKMQDALNQPTPRTPVSDQYNGSPTPQGALALLGAGKTSK